MSDVEFGGELDQITVFVVSAFGELSENERWAAARDKLSFKAPLTGQSCKVLSIGVPIPPAHFCATDVEKGLKIVALALRERLRSRPKRVPKGFEYERCASAISAALAAYLTV